MYEFNHRLLLFRSFWPCSGWGAAASPVAFMSLSALLCGLCTFCRINCGPGDSTSDPSIGKQPTLAIIVEDEAVVLTIGVDLAWPCSNKCTNGSIIGLPRKALLFPSGKNVLAALAFCFFMVVVVVMFWLVDFMGEGAVVVVVVDACWYDSASLRFISWHS